ncbi:MAG: type II secretion system protein [Bacilli bacterium]|nr:type II secretion system protein [Bacilli bacterium]
MKNIFNQKLTKRGVRGLKSKAFTLIELLAVIVILAVIALILTPQILSVINEAKEGSLEATKKSIIKASELYVVSNIEDFTLEVGEKAYIQLSELEDGYIKSLKNTSGESCVGYVKVEKTEKDYDYTVYLDCGNGENLLVDSSYVNYGGNYLDEFQDVIETSDGGYLAVGRSNSSTFSDNMRYGDTLNYDAIIVKYDSNGLEEWSHNFGGTSNDYFYSVVDEGSGYVVVGSSHSQDEDMADMGDNEATIYGNSILVKYNYSGTLIDKKILTNSIKSSAGSYARKILYQNGNYYIIGDGRYVLSSGYQLQYIIKLNDNFNEMWKKTYGGSDYTSASYSGIINKDGNIVTAGLSQATNLEMDNIKIGVKGNSDATIFIINSGTGEIISKGIFGGTSGTDKFSDVIEVDDGYIAVGYSNSIDMDMMNLDKGGDDAIVVKYSNIADENGVLPIVWKKVIGGTNNDEFRTIEIYNNSLYLIGYSNSIDGDLENITKANNEYYDGFIVKMDLDGNVISKKTYGGSTSDYLYSGSWIDDNLIVAGSSFSLDDDMETFNLGNSDAIMSTIDSDLNIVNSFKLETLLMSSQKELVVNYGTSIPTVEGKDTLKLYTTNDATTDLESWCSSSSQIDPNSNYNYVPCLQPFDSAEIKTIYNDVVNVNNNINATPNNNSDWLNITLRFGSTNQTLSPMVENFKIKFVGKEATTVEEAVNLGYIEPLVLIGYIASGDYFFPNTYNILSGESSGIGNYPMATILIKPNDQLFEGLIFTSGGSYPLSQASIIVKEYLNFDISLTPNTN